MAFHLDDISAVPHKPWVYFFYGKKEEILYIWKAKDLKNRVKQYFAAGSLWKQDMLSKATKIDFVTVKTESEALYLEDNLIKKHKPMYNSLLKWDNSYVYIKITKDPYPLVYTTRSRINDWSLYLGPKHMTRDLYKLLQFLRQLFRYRGCTSSVFKQWKICSDYHFGTCKWRCVYAKLKDVSQDHIYAYIKKYPVNAAFNPEMTYEESLVENKRIIKMLVDFFWWKTKPVEDQIMTLMQEAVSKERYEYAAQLRDVYSWISRYTEKQHVIISEQVTWKVMKIRTMEWRYVTAIINMYEGKMIDVIRLKYRSSDTEIDDIISDFRAEYGETVIEELWNWILVTTTTLKKIPKKVRTEIESLLDNFIDAQIASSTFEKENIMSDLLQWLETRYEFPRFPYAIECIDISHLSWWWTSGALVSMREGLLNKKGYRRYKIKWGDSSQEIGASKKNIKNMSSSDDYASLREVLIRRFHWVDIENDFIPDIFIIDWWKWQLWVIKELYDEKERFRTIVSRVWFCWLWKWDARKRSAKSKWEKEELYRFEKDWKITSKELQYDDVDRLMTTLRDEAHRFANKYRTKQMSMERKSSPVSKKEKPSPTKK